MALPTEAFLRASLKFWQTLQARDARRLKRDKHKIAVRVGQLAKRREFAHAHPTVMYDSVTLTAIPPDAPAVAGYTSGNWPTFPDVQKRWPGAKHLSVAVNAAHDADCLDVEKGDATIAEAAGWIKRQHARKIQRIPVIYIQASDFQALVNAMSAANLKYGVDYLVWSAHFLFKPHLCGPGCGFGIKVTAHATQWTDKALGRNLDQSLVSPGFWS